MINNITGKTTNKKSIINSIRIDNIKYNDRKTISNHMCSFFSSVGHWFTAKIPSSKNSIHEYNKNIIRNCSTILVAPTNPVEVSNLIDSLPNKYSSGWDGISNVLLKSMKVVLCKPLSVLFNRSIEEGIFPNIFKSADVIPLYKSGATNLCNNYRPISLLLMMSKLLEKILYKRVYLFLTNTGQIYQSQYGFRSKHSCEHAIQELLGNILKAEENKKVTAVIFLDLSKAFNSLNLMYYCKSWKYMESEAEYWIGFDAI